MLRARSPRHRPITLARPRCSGLAALRFAYFSQAGEAASRYHIRFDRILKHLWQARNAGRVVLVRSIHCVDDLVHVVACVDGAGLAWSDLAERYERALIRRCRGYHDEIEATILVRRMLADMRRRCAEPSTIRSPTLRGYIGDRPLRNWIGDRLNAIRTRAAISQVRRRAVAACDRIGRLEQTQSWPNFSSDDSAGAAVLRFAPAPALAAPSCPELIIAATAE